MIKLLIGGSPCTHWSIAQKNNRETEPNGLGWDLFKNYLIAKEKFKPDLFLYENNKSASKAIKEQISRELGVDLMYINSALVSAQNRQRFYAFNWEVKQPADRGILLKDILESGERIPPYGNKNKARPTNALYPNNAGLSIEKRIYSDNPNKQQIDYIAEPINVCQGVPLNVTKDNKSQTIKAQYQNTSLVNICCYKSTYGASGVAEPVGVTSEGKLYCLTATYGGACARNTIERGRRSMVAEPIALNTTMDGKAKYLMARCYKDGIRDMVANDIERRTRVAVPVEFERTDKPVYEVKNGMITIKGKQYPIKLADGFYIIRKLTPVECERLQTLPDGFTEYGREYASQSFKEGLKIWQNVTSRDVITKSQIVATDCVTNIVYDCNDMEQQNSLDQRLIRVKNAQLRVVSENKKPRKATVLCATNDGLELEIPSCLKEKLRNVKFAVNQRLQKNFVESTIRILSGTEMLSTPTLLEMVLTQEDTESVNIRITKSNIDSLVRELSAENSQKMILPTILTLISQIMMKVTWSYVPKAVTSDYIINLNNVLPNSISWDILNLKMESVDLISDRQRYKGLGNGWTAEVIIHILNGALKDIPKDEEIVVLSMYDGIGTGRYCLDKMGFTNVKYYAYEIDKYAKQIAMSNYPDIIQMGDAFQVRELDWEIPCK